MSQNSPTGQNSPATSNNSPVGGNSPVTAPPAPPTTNLVARFKSTSGITQSGGNATAWADTLTSSGLVLTASGTVPYTASGGANNRPHVTTGPSGAFSAATSFLATGAKAILAFVRPAGDTGGSIAFIRTTSSAFGAAFLTNGLSTVFDYSNLTANANLIDVPMYPGVPAAYGWRTDGTASQVKFSQNGIDWPTTGQAYAAETGTAGTLVGKHPAGAGVFNFVGDFYELLFYSALPSAGDLAQAQAYFAAEYGAPYEPTMGASARVTLVGDSITAGYNGSLDPSFSWTVQLQAALIAKFNARGLTPPTFTNTAVIGQTSAQCLAGYATQIHATNPTDIIVMINGNDGLQSVPFATTRSNDAAIWAQTKADLPNCNIWGVTCAFNSGENWPNGANSLDSTDDCENLILAASLAPYMNSVGRAKMINIKTPCMAYEAANNPSHATSGILTQDGIHPTKPLGTTQMSGFAFPFIKTVAD